VSGARARRILVIRNPSAGVAAKLTPGGGSADALRALLERHGIAAEVIEPEDEDAARSAVRKAVAEHVDVVVAAGGDGTVHVVAEELIGSDAALGILPMGRVMNIARALGIGRDPEHAAEILAAGHVRSVDVGEAMASNGRTVSFLETGSVGLNAAIFREISRADEGELSSILGTIWAAVRYRPARMSVELDDGVVQTRALMVTASIGPYVGLAMTVAPSARLDDGRFDVSIFRRFSKWELLRHLASIAFGRRQYAPQVSRHRSANVRITSRRPLPARADHYDLGTTPVSFRTKAHALLIVAPAKDADSVDARAGGPQSIGTASSGSGSGRRRM
jgi:diacylglycerol kinase (ATP)